MKPLTLKLIRKLLYRLDKALDMPKYRVKHENIMVHVSENHVHISHKGTDNFTSVTLSKETYFAIKDKIKSFDKKNGNISDTVNNQER